MAGLDGTIVVTGMLRIIWSICLLEEKDTLSLEKVEGKGSLKEGKGTLTNRLHPYSSLIVYSYAGNCS